MKTTLRSALAAAIHRFFADAALQQRLRANAVASVGRFDPERFTAERKAGRPRFAYFPFGGGNRQCIGESFAWMEATLSLVTIAQHWRLRLVPGQPVDVQPKITLRPKYPVRMIPERR